MTTNRPTLTNLLVTMTFQMRQEHPEVFEKLGRPFAEDEKVAVYDVLTALSGRDFDACWEAIEKAEEKGLVEFGSGLNEGWITSEGSKSIEASKMDVIDVVRRALPHLDEDVRSDVEDALSRVVKEDLSHIKIKPSEAEGLDLDIMIDPSIDDILDIDDLPDLDEEPAALNPRRPRP